MTDEAMTAAPEAPAAVETAAPESPQWAPEVVEEAKALGWKSKDEWRGELPPNYIEDPARYLERAENFTPFKKQREKLEALERQAEERLRKLETVMQKAVAKQKADFDAQIAAIQAEKRRAVQTADEDAYTAAEQREAALRTQRDQIDAQPEPQTPANNAELAAIEAWRADKPWFGRDRGDSYNHVMSKAVRDLYEDAKSMGITTPAERLKFVDKHMKAAYPQAYGTPEQPKAAPAATQKFDGGLTFGASPTAFSKLPKDAQATFQRFVKQGLFKDTPEDRATYAEDYNAA